MIIRFTLNTFLFSLTYIMKRKGIVISLGIIVALLLALILTCPKADDHREAVRAELGTSLSDTFNENGMDSFAPLVQSIILPAATNMVTVSNYTVCSVGRFEWKGKSHVVSVGVLGHVYVLSDGKDLSSKLKDFTGGEE